MIKLGILGDIGSGKSVVAKQFGYPIFNADREVTKIYKTEKSCYLKLKKKLPKYINSYPVKKKELGKGYAIEGTRRWIEFGFEYCNFDQIFSITKKTNFINIHINKRLGLKIDHSYDEKDEYHKMYILKP